MRRKRKHPAVVRAYEPSESEVLKYAAYLGIDINHEADLLWLARDGLRTPPPKPWVVCRSSSSGHHYFFDPKSGASRWIHPLHERFQADLVQARRERRTGDEFVVDEHEHEHVHEREDEHELERTKTRREQRTGRREGQARRVPAGEGLTVPEEARGAGARRASAENWAFVQMVIKLQRRFRLLKKLSQARVRQRVREQRKEAEEAYKAKLRTRRRVTRRRTAPRARRLSGSRPPPQFMRRSGSDNLAGGGGSPYRSPNRRATAGTRRTPLLSMRRAQSTSPAKVKERLDRIDRLVEENPGFESAVIRLQRNFRRRRKTHSSRVVDRVQEANKRASQTFLAKLQSRRSRNSLLT